MPWLLLAVEIITHYFSRRLSDETFQIKSNQSYWPRKQLILLQRPRALGSGNEVLINQVALEQADRMAYIYSVAFWLPIGA